MLQTITIGSYISVQGLLVRHLPDGKMIVRVDDKQFVGTPIALRKRGEAASA